MRKESKTILLLHRNAEFRERVIAAAGKEFSVCTASDWSSLQKEIERSSPSTIAIVDPFAGQVGAATPARQLQQTLHNFPSIVLFAGLESGSVRNATIRLIERWGVAEIISIGHDDTPEALRSRIRRSRGLTMRRLIDEILPGELPGRARAILHAAADVVTTGGSTDDLAGALGLSTRTLQRWVRRSALPPTRSLLAWMRVLLAASLLDDPGRSIESVAVVCGYSSGSSLRRISQTLLHLHPAELRRLGAFSVASERFVTGIERFRKLPS